MATMVNRKDLAAWLERRGYVRDLDRTGGHLHYKRLVHGRWEHLAIPGHGPLSIPPPTMGAIMRKLKAYGFDKQVVYDEVGRGL
jgi:predicted RNA binding protein YcfA (HicA-like mRNA interferase family)